MFRQVLALTVLGTVIGTAAPLDAQETRPVAITNARILTIESKAIENGTILIRDGRIAEVGAKVTIPPGSRVVDAKGGSVMPGLVSAWSRAGLTRARPARTARRQRGRGRRFRGRRPTASTSKASNRAATKIVDSIYARQDVFGELLHAGITTLAVHPNGNGFPGQAALLDPAAKDSEHISIDETLYLAVIPEKSTAGKKVMKDALDAAKKLIEERKKAKEAPKTAKPAEPKSEAKATDKKAAENKDTKPTPKPAPKPKPDEKKTPTTPPKEGKAPTSKPQPKAKKPDPNVLVLANLLEGKERAFVQAGSANDLSHYLGSIGEYSFPTTIVAASQAPRGFAGFRRRGSGNAGGSLTLMIDQLKKLGASVLMPPTIGTEAGTNILVNEPAELSAAGIEVGFFVGESKSEARNLFFQLIDLVRHGLSPETALRAVTLTPAKMLKQDAEVGSIKAGKQANLLLFSGDPLDPSSKLLEVFYRGNQITKGRVE